SSGKALIYLARLFTLSLTHGRDLVERNRRGNTGVQRLGRRRDRNRDDLVAVLGDETRQTVALATDHDQQRAVGQLDLGHLHIAATVKAEHEDALLLELLDDVREVRSHRDRDACRGARAGLPCGRVEAGGTTLRNDDSLTTECGGRADDRTEVTRIRHAVERD